MKPTSSASVFYLLAVLSALIFACADQGGSSNNNIDGFTSPDLIGGDTPTDGTGDVPSDTGNDQSEMVDGEADSDTGMDMTSPDPCQTEDDCGPAEVCTLVDGQLVCQTPQGGGNLGDACSTGTDCVSGICSEDRCARPCLETTDCPGAFVCEDRTVDGTDVSLCVVPARPCDANGDCSSPQVCVVDRTGDPLESVCDEPVGTGASGDACNADSDCASNLCLDGSCSARCERPNDCPSGQTCRTQDVPLDGGGSASVAVCVPRPAMGCISDTECNGNQICVVSRGSSALELTCGEPVGSGNYGESCGNDSECANNLCLNGLCASPCDANSDCSAQTDYSCELATVDLGGGASDSASFCLPPTTCAAPDECVSPETCFVRTEQSGITLLCQDSNVGGASLGQQCADDSDCAENLCVEGRFGSYCATPCVDAADCSVTGYGCEANDLQAGDGSTVSVDVCTPPAATPCVNTDDCGAGAICGVVSNEAGSGLESVCIPAGAGSQTGIPCSVSGDCQSRACVDGFCAALCDGTGSGAECIQDQICVEKTVSDGGLNGDFDVCLTLPDVPCDSTDDCSAAVPEDNVRVCGDIRNSGAFCTFPNPAPATGLGTSCTVNTDCETNVCLGINNECSLVCADDGDCSSGFICTEYNLQAAGVLGLCNRACLASGDCQNGNACVLNPDTVADNYDQVCEVPPGNGTVGDPCSTASDCNSGLCLTTQLWVGQCANDGSCPSGSSCFCRTQQTCSAGDADAQCLQDTPTNLCSGLCNSGVDCSGGSPLTSCGSVDVTRPAGTGTVAVSACVQP